MGPERWDWLWDWSTLGVYWALVMEGWWEIVTLAGLDLMFRTPKYRSVCNGHRKKDHPSMCKEGGHYARVSLQDSIDSLNTILYESC